MSGFHNSGNYNIVQNFVANLANDNVNDFIKNLVRQLSKRSAEVSVGAVSLTGAKLLPLEVRRDVERLDLDLAKQGQCEQNNDVNITAALTQASKLLAVSGRGKKAVILIADQQLGDVNTSQMELDSFSLISIDVGCNAPRKLGETTDSIVEKLCQD